MVAPCHGKVIESHLPGYCAGKKCPRRLLEPHVPNKWRRMPPRRNTRLHPNFLRGPRTSWRRCDKDLWHGKWPADSDLRQRHLYDEYSVQEAGLKLRSTISHPRVEPRDPALFGAATVFGARESPAPDEGLEKTCIASARRVERATRQGIYPVRSLARRRRCRSCREIGRNGSLLREMLGNSSFYL